MTVFKTFLKILNRCKIAIIINSAIMIFIAVFNMRTSEIGMHFVASRPDIAIIDNDGGKIASGIVSYMRKGCDVKDIRDRGDALSDALFYRDLNFIIYIPKGYSEDFMSGKNPVIEVKSTGDYMSSYARMILERYTGSAKIYLNAFPGASDDEIVKKTDASLSLQAKVEITSKLDAGEMQKTTFYYNFLSYTMLAGAITSICLILLSFREEKIRKRIAAGGMNYKKHNMILILSCCLFTTAMWMIYNILGFIVCGSTILKTAGLIYAANSFIFAICCESIAFLIANLVNNKNAISGIVNVVALGSSFLCGAFVPVEWLSDIVLKIAHILPSYWYIQTNELLKKMEIYDINSLKPIFINMGVMIMFVIIFAAAANITAAKQRVASGK